MPGLPGPETLEVGWSSSSSEESPLYATRPVRSLFTTGSGKKKNGRRKKKKKKKKGREHIWKRGEGGGNHRPAARVTENVLGGNETLMDFNFISATIGWWLGPFKRAAGRRHRSSGAPTPNQYPASRQRHMEEKKTQKKRKTQKQERFLLAKEKKGKETQQVIRTRRYGGD